MKRLMERRRMGFGYFCSIFVLSLFFIHSFCQQPNTDEYFVSDFLHKMGFNLSVSVCSWKGVQCDVSEVYILGLNVSNMGLSGLIPDNSIGKLSKLQILDLSNNKITGLPSDFWSLGSLKILNLSSNQFSGYLPSNIGNFGHLQALDISNNNFSGNIPEAVSSLASLKILKLNQNGFESSIPSGLMSCPSLVSIDLSSNHLRGYLPKGFFSAFPNLEWLNIAVNGIRGQESDFLGMSSISYLNLSRNQFQVNLSYTFNWSNMVYLDLSENQFGGGILLTKFISEAKKLKQLNLAFTRLESRGFPKIMKSPGLEYLNLSGLNLTGQIPTEISKMKSLKILDLSFNNLSGEVPLKVLDKLLLMERFNFSYNNNLTLCDSEFSTEILQSVFIGSTNICPIAANPDSLRRKSSHHKWVTLALVVTVTLVICVLVVALLFLAFGYGCGCKRKKKNTWTVKKQESFKEETSISGPFSFQTDSMTWVADIKLATSVPVVIFEKPLLNFTFADLLSATSNFERGTLLAEGRFGPVYRGFLPGGTHVAVKVLVHGSTMTDQEAAREFEYLGRIKHPNLVPLMGYCLAGDQRIAIYDYMENGNLQNLLHDLPLGVLQTSEVWSRDIWDDDDDNDQNVGSERVLTNWRFRHKIALGTARALAFLHHGCSPPIIHREVKASSVYLDSSLEPRLSDFGLSKILGHVNENGNETESLTLKSDVYGFGVILFELISGKRAMEDDEEGSLVRWVRGLVKRNGGLIMAIDPKIQGTGPDEHMEEMLKIGYLCTADLPSKRPSMQQVVGLLKDIDPLKNHL